MLRRKRCSARSARAFCNRHVLVREHRQHAVADQLQHLAAGVVDGVDRGLRIIIEERDDLAPGSMLSLIAVEPRKSENHSTALMRSVTPRAIRPRSTCSEASRPR